MSRDPHTLAYNARVGLGDLSVGSFHLTENPNPYSLCDFRNLNFSLAFLAKTRTGLAMRASPRILKQPPPSE